MLYELSDHRSTAMNTHQISKSLQWLPWNTSGLQTDLSIATRWDLLRPSFVRTVILLLISTRPWLYQLISTYAAETFACGRLVCACRICYQC